MTRWTHVTDRAKYAVAISNFNQDGPYRLHLIVGETVHMLQENGEWLYGCSTKNKNVWGIFPKSYVSVKESIVDKTGQQEAIIPREPPIVQEITSVLREWGVIWKHLYVSRESEFDVVRSMMYELMEWRRKIMSGTLPVDELKELKQKATAKIDMGNVILGLDLVVRDEHGNILNPDATSAINLYRAHESATQRIKLMASNAIEDTKNQKSSTRYVHSFYVTVKNFVCRIGEDADLLMTLYDGKDGKYISENYLLQWSKEGLTKDLDQLNNLRVIFTDLGSKDLIREKVYLVCQIIRIGAMEFKEQDHKRSTHMQRKSQSEGLRRPFGVAAMEITDIMNGKLESDEEKQYFIPFVQCNERDFLDNLLRKVLASKEVTQKEHKGQGLWVCLKLLHGDLKQVKEENPHLISPSTAVARKMGFPEVILPGDVRNDLYLTLSHGEFTKGAKSSDRNVEVTVKACNEKGQFIENVISLGTGAEAINDYKSVIYYHEDKPKWMETIKIAIPIEEFYNAHLKFTFKHRSSNEAKDRVERAFAFSFVKLMQDNGTTLKDEIHELLVYKIDHKRFDDNDAAYLSLPSTRPDLERYLSVHCLNHSAKSSNNNVSAGGLSLSSKDSFHISSLVCSTKLTQNVDLLGLLKWWSNPENLESNLNSLMKVDGEEVVKFLQDTLDALFNILMQNSDSELYDNLVFEALIFIIGLISDRKYHHFRPVLDMYIKENFSATLTYNKLMVVLKYYVENALQKEFQDQLLRAMKSIEYIFKFIVRSRQLFAELNEDKGQELFEISLKELLKSFTAMMLHETDSTLLVQGACLKYFPFAIPDILSVFDGKELSHILTQLIKNVPKDRLTKQKMMCVNDLVHSDIFRLPDSRIILLPMICDQIRPLLESKKEEMELCVKILSDIMVILYNRDIGPTCNDLSELMLSILRTIIQCVVHLERNTSLVGNMVATMISLLRQMTPYHYSHYIKHFNTKTDLLDFIMEILLVFKDLVGSKTVYPSDWNEMIMLQNSVILKALRHFSITIRDRFTNPFENQVWNNFFHCAIAFLTQDAIQLENFSQNKRNKIISRYKDMRRETGFEIRAMWFNLGQHKIHFVPGMVGPFLEMTLIPEVELRKATIPIFFDMMQCEFYAIKPSLGYEDMYNREIKYNFEQFEHEMITKLDMLVEGGRGDEEYKELFLEIVGGLCENHQTMHEQGMKFVKTVVRLMKRLLEYRSIVTDENKENRMSCTVNLLEFYHEINRREMYIRYLYKLCDLHLECDNYVEAAFTLKLHAKLLRWSEEPLSQLLKNDKHPNCETHRELKECLYYDILNYFDKGKLWETGLTICKELAVQYENEVFDYIQLSALLKRMAAFYDNIMKQVRAEPEYFRVAYYGRGFPPFLQNKIFVYRGKEYERLSDFSSRLLNQYPLAQLMTKLAPPGEDITESDKQYLQINKVDPGMHERERFRNKSVHDQILKYYKVNEVQKFTYSRPLRKGQKDSDNEFATMWLERTNLVTSYPLPGILHWFPVTSCKSIEISPLENAIEIMDSTNFKICNLILQHKSDPMLPINPLSMLLNGVVDAAVNGGIINYERAFFTEEFAETHNAKKDVECIQKLKDLIACQVPLLEAGILIHKLKAPGSLKPFHQHMEERFHKLRTNIEENYGKKGIPLELQDRMTITVRRAKTFPAQTNTKEGRLSDVTQSVQESPRKVQSAISSMSPSSKISPNIRGTSIFVKPASTSSTKSMGRKNRESSGLTLRRSSAASLASQNSETQSQSQWYDITPTNSKSDGLVFELSEQLTPHRPLRSEAAEKRLSRPSSGQFHNQKTPSPTRMSRSPSASLYSLSLPSTPSILSPSSPTSISDVSEEKPPPLPQKQAYADYTNITDDMQFSSMPRKNSLSLSLRSKNKPPPPLPVKESTPATPNKKLPLAPTVESDSPPEVPKKPTVESDSPPEVPKKPTPDLLLYFDS